MIAINKINGINRPKTVISEVNKRINAFWEVHIQKQKITKNETLFVYFVKHPYSVYLRLIYIFITCLSYTCNFYLLFVYSVNRASYQNFGGELL